MERQGLPKLCAPGDLLQKCQQLRQQGKRVVFTNGCFDLLHVGHIRYLRQARALGDCLIVGLNSDGSMRQLKGPERPLVPQEERAEILAALSAVDHVVIFEELTAERLVSLLRPDIYVKGGDYQTGGGKELPEERIVASYGGRVVILPLVPGRSTSSLIENIRQRYR